MTIVFIRLVLWLLSTVNMSSIKEVKWFDALEIFNYTLFIFVVGIETAALHILGLLKDCVANFPAQVSLILSVTVISLKNKYILL